MTRIGFCPYCKSSQPEQPGDKDPSEAFCQVCRYSLRVEPTQPVPFRPATIHRIDDDQLLLSFCCDALNQHGYQNLVIDAIGKILGPKAPRPKL
jgi:hypothetical protein